MFGTMWLLFLYHIALTEFLFKRVEVPLARGLFINAPQLLNVGCAKAGTGGCCSRSHSGAYLTGGGSDLFSLVDLNFSIATFAPAHLGQGQIVFVPLCCSMYTCSTINLYCVVLENRALDNSYVCMLGF